MSKIIVRRIGAFLDSEKLSYETEVVPEKAQQLWISDYREQIEEVYQRLGGQASANIADIKPAPYPMVFEGRVIFADEELAHNRYTATRLRALFYSGNTVLNVEAYLRYCRQFEINCKKVGLLAGVWSNKLSEHHFGQASDPGDFFGSGSSGWKMLTFQDLLSDMLAAIQGYEVLHFSIYDQIMYEGKLLTLGELLKSPSSDHYAVFTKYLRRRLGLPVTAAEKPV